LGISILINILIYRLTKVKQPTTQQVSEYITDDNWMSFLKRHVDAIDEKKTFRDHPRNLALFTRFIRLSFNLFVQEHLLNKEVMDSVKNLNHITADMKVFIASGKDILQDLDVKSLLNLNNYD